MGSTATTRTLTRIWQSRGRRPTNAVAATPISIPTWRWTMSCDAFARRGFVVARPVHSYSVFAFSDAPNAVVVTKCGETATWGIGHLHRGLSIVLYPVALHCQT